ncbi:GDSL-type esterase/lipase family protein [Pinibacter aurantiacus]|uniref:Prolyl oligopeptidase family serine peptidase n=1 Tax=Pinibacter aurantiacus TaxID=2851599 RepID=A0A9E2W4K1_9BACT|nr:GDSL-type esterase/lipase family protein [Pinibacter aurantiacus]MBV4357573.1 prolyl oligopeptidase family serine peptidase [Pinibacter aurantiacus]
MNKFFKNTLLLSVCAISLYSGDAQTPLPANDLVAPNYTTAPMQDWEKKFSDFSFNVYKKNDHVLPYRLYKPAAQKGEKYPLVLFMHGAGERGVDNRKQFLRFSCTKFWEKYPCYVLAPQCPERKDVDSDAGAVWVHTPFGAQSHSMQKEPTWPMQLSFELLDRIIKENNIDRDRIYITGLSMGGFATWEMLQRHPELFAAGIPICGGGDTAFAGKLSRVPLWVFHGDADSTVPVTRSRAMVQQVVAKGGHPRYTEYPGVGHDSWSRTYPENEVWDWLFAQSKKKDSPKKIAYGSLEDDHIKYIGRWDKSNVAEYVSRWGGAYFKVAFTGTKVKLRMGTNKTNYYVKIDNGPWISYKNVSDTIDITPVALSKGKHTLSVAQGKDYNYVFSFRGLILEHGAVTSDPPVSPFLIEFIGDSITAGYTDDQANVSDYAWISAEKLGAEHTQIAYPGITLVSGYPKGGMDNQYFRMGSPASIVSPMWEMNKYVPDMIVINLGTNDNNKRVPDSVLQANYTEFLFKIRKQFPNAQVLVMRTFLGVKVNPTLAAVNARIAAGDKKLHYVDTEGWLTKADYGDGLHPSVEGQMKAAGLLMPVIEKYR